MTQQSFAISSDDENLPEVKKKSQANKSINLEADIANPSFPVVAVGASAGGLEAFKEFLRVLPSDIGMAFVFVQHLDPHAPSNLTEILARETELTVITVVDGVKLKPNYVYVLPRA